MIPQTTQMRIGLWLSVVTAAAWLVGALMFVVGLGASVLQVAQLGLSWAIIVPLGITLWASMLLRTAAAVTHYSRVVAASTLESDQSLRISAVAELRLWKSVGFFVLAVLCSYLARFLVFDAHRLLGR